MAPIALASGAKEMEPKKNEQARSDVQSTIIPNWINVLSMNGKKEAREVESTDTEPKTDDSTRLVAPQSTNGVSFNIMDGYEAERVAKLKEALLDINLGSDVSEDQKGAIVEAVIDLETQRKKSTESQVDNHLELQAPSSSREVALLWFSAQRNGGCFVKNAARILESTSFMKLEEIFHEVDGATKTVFNKMSVLVPTISGDSQAISVRTSRIGQVRFSHTNGVPEAFLPQILSSLDVDTSDFPTSLSMLGQEINISALQQLFTPVRNGVNAGLESAQSVVSIVERFLPQQLTDFVRSRADKWVRITCVSGDVLVCRDESDEVYILTKVTTGKEGNEATLESQDEVVAVDESDQAVAL
ncbi:hypothetical protein BSKO_05522 [Bryopsis sp. KO-2023]|nr:hypothetical protein BSKO_05522 [Bryopsis sp. KO-2023]